MSDTWLREDEREGFGVARKGLPDPLTDAGLRQRAERMKLYIRAHNIPGGCRMRSLGDQCQCPLCDVDALLAAVVALENVVLHNTCQRYEEDVLRLRSGVRSAINLIRAAILPNPTCRPDTHAEALCLEAAKGLASLAASSWDQHIDATREAILELDRKQAQAKADAPSMPVSNETQPGAAGQE